MIFDCLEREIDKLVSDKTTERIIVKVGRGSETPYVTSRGNVSENTLFDMASVTKVMVTTPLAFVAMNRGFISPDDCVSKFFDTDKRITIENLLTHTMGIGHKSLNCDGVTYDNVAEKILAIPSDVPVGSEVLYSCPGYILLGKIIEKVFGLRLDKAFYEFVAKPLGLNDSVFLPKNAVNFVSSDPFDRNDCAVNDYNCRFLGGVAGNAGLFSTMSDVTKFVGWISGDGKPIVSRRIFDTALRNHTPALSESRAYGFVYVDDKFTQTRRLFPKGSVGHCGHTGQSVFVNRRDGFYVIILSDATASVVRKYGNENYAEVIKMRTALHNAIKADLESERSVK